MHADVSRFTLSGKEKRNAFKIARSYSIQGGGMNGRQGNPSESSSEASAEEEIHMNLGPDGRLPKYSDLFYTRYKPMTPMQLTAGRQERVVRQFGQNVLDRVYEAYRRTSEIQQNSPIGTHAPVSVDNDAETDY
ncbi:hypothetical protein ACQP0C_31385 [Nocardia sp. CA-129566]|uniref:hypothetical protein n=1 Tax=Nocardia sp. CA-129566 TaxID=3239976 RepID=UPI003D9981BC